MEWDERYRLMTAAAKGALGRNVPKGTMFDWEEMVGQAWCEERVREAETPGEVLVRTRAAIIDHLRKWAGRKGKKYRPKFLHTSRLLAGMHLLHEDVDAGVQLSVGFFEGRYDPWGQVEAWIMLEDVGRGLTARERTVVKLVLAGYTQKEIGQAVGCSGAMVSLVWMEVKERLRERYEQDWQD